jgi:hypothetical protein
MTVENYTLLRFLMFFDNERGGYNRRDKGAGMVADVLGLSAEELRELLANERKYNVYPMPKSLKPWIQPDLPSYWSLIKRLAVALEADIIENSERSPWKFRAFPFHVDDFKQRTGVVQVKAAAR